jgi:hypothetical protein
LPQRFDTRPNRKFDLALLIAAIATRVQCAVIGIKPSRMSRHEDNLKRFDTNGSSTEHRWVEFKGYYKLAFDPSPTYSIDVRNSTVLTVGANRGICRRPREEAP